MTRTILLFHCIALMVMTSHAAVPPDDIDVPIGYTMQELQDYAQQSKPLPFRDSFTIEKKPYNRTLYMPMPEEYKAKHLSEYPFCSLSSGGKDNELNLLIGFPNRVKSSIHYDFTPKLNIVFPIYSELYRVSKMGHSDITIDRITATVNKELIPQGFSSTIYLGSAVAILRHPKSNYNGFARAVAIQPVKDELTATIQIREPFATIQEQYAAIKNNEMTISSEKQYKAGDYIASQYQKYLIKKIVPPGPVDAKDPTKGHYIGWVEIDPRALPVDNKAEPVPKK